MFFKVNLTNVATTICNEETFFLCVMGRLIYKHKILITVDQRNESSKVSGFLKKVLFKEVEKCAQANKSESLVHLNIILKMCKHCNVHRTVSHCLCLPCSLCNVHLKPWRVNIPHNSPILYIITNSKQPASRASSYHTSVISNTQLADFYV